MNVKKGKNIVFVLNNFAIGGVERLLLDLTRELDREYSVFIVTVWGSGPLSQDFRNNSKGVYFAGFNFSFKRGWFFRFVSLLCMPITVVRIIRIFIKVKPDIIITSLYQADIIGGITSWVLCHKKRIIIQHDVQKITILKRWIRSCFAMKTATTIVAVSEKVQEFLLLYWKIHENKITIIKNSINTRAFHHARRKMNTTHLVLGFIGRLEPVKGCECFLSSLEILKNQYKIEPIVRIAGDGSSRKRLEDFADHSSLDNVSFLGLVSNVPEYLKSIDVLVIPSFEEGFGLTVLEGLIAEKIVVASDLLVFQELIDDKKNGRLFPVGDEKKLAEILYEFSIDQEVVSIYQKSLHMWLKENEIHFETKESIKKYKVLIENILQK